MLTCIIALKAQQKHRCTIPELFCFELQDYYKMHDPVLQSTENVEVAYQHLQQQQFLQAPATATVYDDDMIRHSGSMSTLASLAPNNSHQYYSSAPVPDGSSPSFDELVMAAAAAGDILHHHHQMYYQQQGWFLL